jgi:hypothetical protein
MRVVSAPSCGANALFLRKRPTIPHIINALSSGPSSSGLASWRQLSGNNISL